MKSKLFRDKAHKNAYFIIRATNKETDERECISKPLTRVGAMNFVPIPGERETHRDFAAQLFVQGKKGFDPTYVEAVAPVYASQKEPDDSDFWKKTQADQDAKTSIDSTKEPPRRLSDEDAVSLELEQVKNLFENASQAQP